MSETCESCVFRNDWADPGKCYADMEYHEPDDTCPFHQGSLRDEPLEGPEAKESR